METTMSSSRDYEELKYVWSQWRDASGAKMRSNYQNYVSLSNQAAQANGNRPVVKQLKFKNLISARQVSLIWVRCGGLISRLPTSKPTFSVCGEK